MNSKSTLLVFAVLFAGLTATAQDRTAAIGDDVAVLSASPYTFVNTARFDGTVPLYAGSFTRSLPSSNTLVDDGGNQFVTSSADMLAQGSYAGVIGVPDTTAPAPVIPEPETYALMALGLGAIGFSRRHRQSRAN